MLFSHDKVVWARAVLRTVLRRMDELTLFCHCIPMLLLDSNHACGTDCAPMRAHMHAGFSSAPWMQARAYSQLIRGTTITSRFPAEKV